MVYASVKGAGAPGGFKGFLQAYSVDGMTVTQVGQYVPPGPTPLAFSLAVSLSSQKHFYRFDLCAALPQLERSTLARSGIDRS